MSVLDDPDGNSEQAAPHVAALRSLVGGTFVGPPTRHIATVAGSDILPPTTKLAMLAHLKQKAGAGDTDHLRVLADALIDPSITSESQRGDIATELIDRVDPTPGSDPLGRTKLDADPDVAALLTHLVPEISEVSMAVLPSCDARRIEVGGAPVLFVQTEYWSRAKLSAFREVVNPLEWPKCPVQQQFFKSVTLDPPTTTPLAAPDDNHPNSWSGTVLEVVDFGFGHGEMETLLDVVYVESADAIGCTYSMPLGGSLDGRIQHDQGFLLAQDFEASEQARRITSLKAVWFTEENTPVNQVCPVWSFATALVAHACVQEK